MLVNLKSQELKKATVCLIKYEIAKVCIWKDHTLDSLMSVDVSFKRSNSLYGQIYGQICFMMLFLCHVDGHVGAGDVHRVRRYLSEWFHKLNDILLFL